MKKKGKAKVKNKELETSITVKFTELLHGLGHNVESIKKEITKAGKAVSEKITSVLKDAQKVTAKEVGKANKLTKKAGKKKNNVKPVIKKADAKVDKVVSAVAKSVSSGKSPTASGRSVAKPAAPTLDTSRPVPAQKEEVKEASTPVKRTRAPRRKKEEIAAASAEKTPVKEASAPVKRKRSPNKPKLVTTSEEKPATETTGSAVL